jgi:SGNH hydrolase-like domain, acetyltransferase AlgX
MVTAKAIVRSIRQTLLIVLITLVLAEITFRIYHYINPSFVFYDDSYNRFRGRPGAPDFDFRLNSKGFKDLEYKQNKDDGVYRIIGIGDSFAFGVVPYPYVYLTRLEEILAEKWKRTEVINMGIVKTGPNEYLALLVNEGLDLKPDMVLVSFFIGNDFQQKRTERKLYTYSYVASFIDFIVTVGRGYEGKILDTDGTYKDAEPTLTDEAFIALERKRSEMFRKQNTEFQESLAWTVQYLAEMKHQCDLRSTALTIVVLPDELQINPAVQARVFDRDFGERRDDFDFTLPNRMLSEKLKELDIEYIDLLEDVVRAGEQKPLYKPNDSHLNIEGNELVARMIADELFLRQNRALHMPGQGSLTTRER